jgi:hypothetical protein
MVLCVITEFDHNLAIENVIWVILRIFDSVMAHTVKVETGTLAMLLMLGTSIVKELTRQK